MGGGDDYAEGGYMKVCHKGKYNGSGEMWNGVGHGTSSLGLIIISKM
jgi:hypothetical protein